MIELVDEFNYVYSKKYIMWQYSQHIHTIKLIWALQKDFKAWSTEKTLKAWL